MKLKLSFVLIIVSLVATLWITIDQNKRLSADNKIKENNISALKDINKQLADTTNKQAVEVRVLRLTKQEFVKYKEGAEKRLAKMDLELKNIKAVGYHGLQLKIPVSGKLEVNVPTEPNDEGANQKDSISITIPYMARINIEKPFLKVTGSIVADSIDMNIVTDVELDQEISVIPKHKFLWWSWGVKGVKQTMHTDNPYVRIKYSEFIEIK